MKNYEVYGRKYSMVIQSESITMAMSEFWSANPTEEIIIVENIEARNEAIPAPSSTPQSSVEGILDSQVFNEASAFKDFKKDFPHTYKAIVKAMQEYGNQLVGDKDLIIQGLEEGSEQWQSEYNFCRAILKELVQLKEIKDKDGKTEDYLKRQPLVWQAAKDFLSKYQHL